MPQSQPEYAAVLVALLRNDATAAGERMALRVSRLSEGTADFLHFVRSSGHTALFKDET